MFDLKGRVALVTGAGQSVGAGIAAVLARQGAAVIVNDVAGDRAEKVAAEICEHRQNAVAAAFDVTDLQESTEKIRAAESVLGHHVDILVHNAGVASDRATMPFRELDPEQWRPSIDLNLYGLLNTARVVIDGMCDRGWGRVIQISSGSARTGQNIGVSMYAAGKSGGEGFMRHLAAEVGQFGVTANILALGHQKNLEDKMPPEMISRILATIPIGRLGDPEEVGAACAYLASKEAAGLTGQTIDFNGGSQTR